MLHRLTCGPPSEDGDVSLSPGSHPPVVEAKEIQSFASLSEVHDAGLGLLELKAQFGRDGSKRDQRRFRLGPGV
jgi:hypothetical protein